MRRTVVLSAGLALFAPPFAAHAAEHPRATDNWSEAPVADWPTNGGNYANQRYSPLARIDRGNVAQAQGRLADAAARLGHRRAVLGRGAADRLRRRRLREHGRRRRVRRVDRQRRDPLAVHGEPRPRAHFGLLRLDEQRRRGERRQGIRRPARRAARRARSRDRQGRFGTCPPSAGRRTSRSRPRRFTTTAW